jgi:predicted Zn finger-like uncharacterized protein
LSLATRCTACGTVFRVVQDQLRVSNGWVRCGRCSEVFNAVESLVDLDAADPLADGGPPSAHGARVMQELARVSGVGDLPAPAETKAVPAVVDPTPPAAAAFDAAAGLEAAGESAPDIRADIAPEPSLPAPLAAPGFVRQAERAERWRRPGVRAGLAALALALALLLGWQVHRSHHDWIAARWPAVAPVVQRLCATTGCIVEPPRRLESLVVESSGLVRAGVAGTYRLTVSLRNRDRLALRLPALDLSLTDAQGRVVARRVLLPGELGATVTSVAAGADLALAATLRSREVPIVGYTIEIFYP